jgi:hypothetical protein
MIVLNFGTILHHAVWYVNRIIPEAGQEGEHDGKARRHCYGGPAESEEHLRLKLYVKANPQEFDAPKNCQVVDEKLL